MRTVCKSCGIAPLGAKHRTLCTECKRIYNAAYYRQMSPATRGKRRLQSKDYARVKRAKRKSK